MCQPHKTSREPIDSAALALSFFLIRLNLQLASTNTLRNPIMLFNEARIVKCVNSEYWVAIEHFVCGALSLEL